MKRRRIVDSKKEAKKGFNARKYGVKRKVGKLISKIEKLDKWKRRAISLALSSVLALELVNVFKDDDEKRKVYLVDLEDKYQNEAMLTDKNGKPINISKNRGDMLAITFDKGAKDGETVEAVLIDDEGQMSAGYIDAKYLDDKSIDKIKVDSELINELKTIGVVVPKNGLYLREKPKFDKHTDDATILGEGKNLIIGNTSTTVKDNSYDWKKGITVVNKRDKKELKEGFVAGEYIRNSKYEDMEGKVFKVNLNDSDSTLALRSDSNTNSEVLYAIPNGTEVLLLPNVESNSDGTYDWFYVAVKTDKDKVICGYVAATYYKDYEEFNFLTYLRDQNIKSKKLVENDKISDRIYMEVDTTSADKIPLKLRVEPSTESSILAELGHGTKVYTYQELLDKELIDNNGRKWVVIYTDTNKSGYVASEYLVMAPEKKELSSEEMRNDDITFGSDEPYKVNGYYGIDVSNDRTREEFERLLTGKLDPTGEYSYSKISNINNSNANKVSNFRDYSSMKKPHFCMIKIGSTGYGDDFHISEQGQKGPQRKVNMEDMVNLCEQYSIPYGFYYYSQCTNEEEMLKEVEYLKSMHQQLSGRFNVFPLALDFEAEGGHTRLFKEVQKNADGRKMQTELLNKYMKLLREAGIEVTTYLDSDGYQCLMDYNYLEDENKKNTWIVECNETRSSDYEKIIDNTGKFVSDAVIRQISLNQGEIWYDNDGNVIYDHEKAEKEKIPVAKKVKIPPFDVDFMNKDYYDKKTKHLFTVKNSESKNSNSSKKESSEMQLNSEQAVLYDMDNNTFLYEKDGNIKASPASITKILTAYIVCKYGNLNDKVKFTNSAINVQDAGSSYTGTKLEPEDLSKEIVKKDGTLLVKDALYISILRSSNPVTVALEEYIEKKTGKKFLDLMNEEAKKIGAKNSHFTNSFGKSEKNNYVTASDMAKIAAYIADNSPETLEILGSCSYVLEDKSIEYKNPVISHETDELKENSEYYNADIVGGKTGYTSDAGQTMVTLYDADGKHFVIVTLGGKGKASKHDDAKTLYDYAIKKLNKNKSKNKSK